MSKEESSEKALMSTLTIKIVCQYITSLFNWGWMHFTILGIILSIYYLSIND